jgi:hypothetical protein
MRRMVTGVLALWLLGALLLTGGCGSDKSTGGDGGPIDVTVDGDVPEFLAGI